MDGLSSLAQQVLEETYISSRVSVTATQLTARYHSLVLNIQVRPSLMSASPWSSCFLCVSVVIIEEEVASACRGLLIHHYASSPWNSLQ